MLFRSNPADGTVWGSVLGQPGYVLRFDPKTKLSEVYEPPFPGWGPRGDSGSERDRVRATQPANKPYTERGPARSSNPLVFTRMEHGSQESEYPLTNMV